MLPMLDFSIALTIPFSGFITAVNEIIARIRYIITSASTAP